MRRILQVLVVVFFLALFVDITLGILYLVFVGNDTTSGILFVNSAKVYLKYSGLITLITIIPLGLAVYMKKTHDISFK